MISTFTLMGCSQTLFAWNPRIRTSLFNTFHLCDQIGPDYAFHETIYFLIVLFGLIILWILCKKKQIICWLCHLNDRYFFLLRKRKVYFIVLARISYLGNFIAIFPSIIMLLLIIHLIYNFLSVVLLLPDPVFRSYSTNNAKMIYIRI